MESPLVFSDIAAFYFRKKAYVLAFEPSDLECLINSVLMFLGITWRAKGLQGFSYPWYSLYLAPVGLDPAWS